MKILLDDGLQTARGTGIAAYSNHLEKSLAALPETEVVRECFPAKGGRIRTRLAYLRYLASAAYRYRVADFDVVHYTNYAMPKKLPHGVLSAVTVHDLAAFEASDTLPRAYAAYNRRMIKRAMRRADIIFTVSHAMREEIAARFPHAAKKVVAVYPGYYAGAVRTECPATYENEALQGLARGRFFLFVGTVERRKNLAELVRAYAFLQRICPAAEHYSLVLAGGFGFGADEVLKEVYNTPDTADIRLPGYVSDADRAKLLGEAAALVFPSLYEGFGSPQTEAMAAGLPLILSDIRTNREVSGELGCYYPLGDEDLLAAAMKRVIEGRLQTNQSKAAARLARFDWQKSAADIRAAYERARVAKDAEDAEDAGDAVAF